MCGLCEACGASRSTALPRIECVPQLRGKLAPVGPVRFFLSAPSSPRSRAADAISRLSQAAGEARREAWRWFGGFWVWLTSMLATGAVIGMLATIWIQGRGDAREFGQYPGIFCGGAGGQVIEQDNGATYCAIWIKPPDQ